MGHSHEHNNMETLRTKGAKAMEVTFYLTVAFLVAEIVGGFWTKSLALLADAGHMLGDAAALGLALIAIRFAKRASSPEKTYGYYRSEILAAFLNCLFLLLMSCFILYEAVGRLWKPQEIMSGPMVIIAVLGLIVNLIGIGLLTRVSGNSLNVKDAYFEVLSDLLGSIAVIVAGVVIGFTNWYWIDPVISGIIGVFILPRTWLLLRECVHILMQGTPERIKVQALESEILQITGVLGIHSIHVWTLTQGHDVLSCHILGLPDQNVDVLRSSIQSVLHDKFDIDNSTIQIEFAKCEQAAA